MSKKTRQQEIKNDGSWQQEETVEAEVEASVEEWNTAAEAQADHSLKILELRKARKRMTVDFNKKIHNAEGEAEAAARTVKTRKRVVMVEATVTYDAETQIKIARAKQDGAVLWKKPMTPEELELGDPGDGAQEDEEGPL